MPYLTLKNNKLSPILVEFKPTYKIKTIKQQIPIKIGNIDQIKLYFNDKLVDEEKTFAELNIYAGCVMIYLIKSEGENQTDSDKIIEMMEQNYGYQKSVIALKKSKYRLSAAIDLANNDDLSYCSSDSDDDESISEFAVTPHIDCGSMKYSSSEDEAEDICSDVFRDSESVNN